MISSIAEVSFMVLAHPSVPAKTLPELIAYAKAKPDKLAVATDGAAAVLRHDRGLAQQARRHQHFLRALHADDAGRAGRARRPRPAHHPRGADRARTHRGRHAAPAGGDVGRRLPDFPDVPTVAETFPGFDFAGWWVLAAPTGVPAPILERVNREMDAILKDPAVVERMSKAGFISRGGGTMQETRDYVQAQHAAWGKLVQEIGLQPE